jgi:hypothetical protein
VVLTKDAGFCILLSAGLLYPVGHYAGYDGGYDVGHYRVTIQEAANRLGVKEGAIRKRIERNTIRSEKDVDSGRVYVFVDEPPDEEQNEGRARYDTNGDGHDTSYDRGYDASYPAGYDMLIKSQQEQIEFLRRELERKDAILLNMTEAVKSLEAPQKAPPALERRETAT